VAWRAKYGKEHAGAPGVQGNADVAIQEPRGEATPEWSSAKIRAIDNTWCVFITMFVKSLAGFRVLGFVEASGDVLSINKHTHIINIQYVRGVYPHQAPSIVQRLPRFSTRESVTMKCGKSFGTAVLLVVSAK
jgi:hypothetical protein